MSDTQRRRGRPKGASRYSKSDPEILAQIADLTTDAKPPLAPTSAMRKLGLHSLTDHKRLMRRWRAEGAQHEHTVRERRQAAAARRSVAPTGPSSYPGAYPPGIGLPADAFSLSAAVQAMQVAGHFSTAPSALSVALGLRPTLADLAGVRDAQNTLAAARAAMADAASMRAIRESLDHAQRLKDILHPPHLYARWSPFGKI